MPITEDKEASLSKGSVYINNTSYSGADIKVLVHLYDPNNAAVYRTRALNNEIKTTDKELMKVIGRIEELRTKLETAKRGTPEAEKFRTQLNQQEALFRQLDISLDELYSDSDATKEGKLLGSVKTLGELQTISISVYRDKKEVRALGCVGPKGVTRGPRIIAGSMIFTTFNKHVFDEIMTMHASEFDGANYTTSISDQLPPLDVTIVFANEYGHLSRMAIYGLEIQSEGIVLSIEDIMTETTMQFLARDFDPMRAVSQRKIDENYRMAAAWNSVRASRLIFEEDYWGSDDTNDPFFRYKSRQFPYL